MRRLNDWQKGNSRKEEAALSLTSFCFCAHDGRLRKTYSRSLTFARARERGDSRGLSRQQTFLNEPRNQADRRQTSTCLTPRRLFNDYVSRVRVQPSRYGYKLEYSCFFFFFPSSLSLSFCMITYLAPLSLNLVYSRVFLGVCVSHTQRVNEARTSMCIFNEHVNVCKHSASVFPYVKK